MARGARLRDVGLATIDGLGAIAVATAAVALLEGLAPVTGLGVVYLLAVLFVASRRGEVAALGPREGETTVPLRLRSRRAWLYSQGDAGWTRAELDRIAEPLARLVDVALERQEAAEREAEAEAARRADVAKTAVLHAISHDL